MKKRRIAAALMAVVLVAVGCGNTAETEETQGQAAQGEAVQEAEPEEEIPVAVYEEDKNIYGNAIGNLNNEGTFLYNKEDGCLYFQNIYNKHVVRVPIFITAYYKRQQVYTSS